MADLLTPDVALGLVALAVAAAAVYAGYPVLLSAARGVRSRALDLAADVRPRLSVRYLKRRVLGPPEQLPRRLGAAAVLLAVATVVAGAWLATRQGVDSVGQSSLPILRPFLRVVTSTWILPILIAIVARNVILYRRDIEARQAAEITGYSERSVKRLGEEVKHPDTDTHTRVIAVSDDDAEGLRDRILEALDGAPDDTLASKRAEYQPDDSESVDDLPTDVERLHRELDDLDARIADLHTEIDSELSAIVGADVDPDRLLAAIVDDDTDRVAPVDLLGDDDRARLADVETKINTLEDLEQQYNDRLNELRDLVEPVPDDPGTPGDDRERDTLGDATDTGDGDTWGDRMKLLRLDLGTTLNYEALAWRVGVPAGVTIILLMIAVQFWVQPFFYLPIFAIGLLVGFGNYIRVERRRSRRLEGLRHNIDAVQWDSLAIHIKEVEVPETRIQIARMAGQTYAHDDRQEFAEEIASRAYQRVNGVQPEPSVMVKQADQLANYRPDLHGFRDAERERIGVWLIDAVGRQGTGLIPKAKLIEEAIEQPAGISWVPYSGNSRGYDPDLVREVYRSLVPSAIVEEAIPIQGSDTGETVRAVRLRDDPLPSEYGAIQAQFSNQFENYARWEPLYELPEVDDDLDADPVYMDALTPATLTDD